MIRGVKIWPIFLLSFLSTPALAVPVPPRIAADYQALKTAAASLPPALAHDTVEALSDRPCVRHRAYLGTAGKQTIIAQLTQAGFLPPTRDTAKQMTGLFPPLIDDDSDCPLPLQPFLRSPGGNMGSHHAWPGGLPQHEHFNRGSAMALSDLYDRDSGVTVDRDLITAAVIWHDWAKMIVFPWQADGTLPPELTVARTGAHHILGLAETMKRGLPARLVIVQACAHTAPVDEDAAKVANWLRAAAIVAQIDPVKAGYLTADKKINWQGPGPWRECLIHTASDANWLHAETVVTASDALLERLAAAFGYDPTDKSRYLNAYRHVVMAWVGPDRLYALASTGGDAAVMAALTDLRKNGLI